MVGGVAVGADATDPSADPSGSFNEAGRAENRRVELTWQG